MSPIAAELGTCAGQEAEFLIRRLLARLPRLLSRPRSSTA